MFTDHAMETFPRIKVQLFCEAAIKQYRTRNTEIKKVMWRHKETQSKEVVLKIVSKSGNIYIPKSLRRNIIFM